MRITVTEEHIRKGQRQACSRCPIALAITEAIGKEFRVGPWSAWDAHPPYAIFELPKEARDFVRRFDQIAPVKPFTFELPVEPTEGREQP